MQGFREMDEKELNDVLQEVQGHVPVDDLLPSVLTWIISDRMNQKNTLDKIMHLIDINSCSKKVLKHCVNQFQQHEEIVKENPQFNNAVSTILNAKDAPVQAIAPVSTIPTLVINANGSSGKCWKLNIKESKEFTEFTTIPDFLFQKGIGLCAYEGVGLILTGGLMDLCAVYQAATNKWHSMKQEWVARRRHASVCIKVSTYLL